MAPCAVTSTGLPPRSRSAADGDLARARALQAAYVQLHAQLRHHHEQEDALIFPALGGLGVDTGLLEEMEDEHRAMSDALGRTAGAMNAYAVTGAASDAAAARTSVEGTRVVVDRHLLHEEAELEPLMADHLESAEWKAVERQLRKAPPTTAGVFFAWLTDGLGPEEERYVKANIPGPVVAVLSRVLGRRYHREIAPIWRR